MTDDLPPHLRIEGLKNPLKLGPHGRHRRVTTSKQWIEQGPLTPWMLKYAQWLAQQPDAVLSLKDAPVGYRRNPPTTQQRTVRATGFACRKIPQTHVRLLEQREDFIGYFEKLRADAQFKAKELAHAAIAANFEAREEALKRATGRMEMPDGTVVFGAMDISEVRQLTSPWVEFGMPKKGPEEEKATRITLVLGSKETKALLGKVLGEDEEIADVEYEVIEAKQLESGDDE